jgi:ubiquinone/menaquinone biosynthesis C-methylase UbiE
MLKEAATKLRDSAVVANIRLVQGDARDMTFPNESFDTVIDTFSLCVAEDPIRLVQEMKRVVKPGGQIVLLENTRSDNSVLGALQDLTEPLVTPLSKNCRWNTNVPALAREAGLQLEQPVESSSLGTLMLGVYTK